MKIDKTKIRGFGKKQILAPYIDKELRTFDEPWKASFEPKGGDTAWHPSSHCDMSPTKLYNYAVDYMDTTDEPSEALPISESLRKSFAVGHFWHQFLQYIVTEQLKFCTWDTVEHRGSNIWKYKNKISGSHLPEPFHWATGSADHSEIDLPSGWNGIIDYKTINGPIFSKISKEEIPFNEFGFAAKYECQINIYMDFFDKDKGMIFGICKDSPHAFHEWIFERNQSLIDAIYAKWSYVSDCLDKEEAPDPEVQFELPLQGVAL